MPSLTKSEVRRWKVKWIAELEHPTKGSVIRDCTAGQLTAAEAWRRFSFLRGKPHVRALELWNWRTRVLFWTDTRSARKSPLT